MDSDTVGRHLRYGVRCYCAAVLIGRITGLARPSVCPVLYWLSFHDLLRPAISHHCDWSVITARDLTPVKHDDWNVSRVCLSHARPTQNTPAITSHEISTFQCSLEFTMPRYTSWYTKTVMKHIRKSEKRGDGLRRMQLVLTGIASMTSCRCPDRHWQWPYKQRLLLTE